MPQKDLKYYLTVGELASLYGVSKQTLIYYASSNILKPAFVYKNGYRYYSVNEFLDLEIILNLRKLDVPSAEIAKFLEKRNTESIIKLLEKKKQVCLNQIDDLNHTIESLQYTIDGINTQDDLILNCFQTLQMPVQKLILSEPFTEKSSKTHIPEFARHNQRIFSKTDFRSLSTGWIIDKDSFIAGNTKHTKYYFTPKPANRNIDNIFEKPAGLYVLINYNGTYYKEGIKIRERLLDYLQRNHLEMISDLYNYPIKNHWQTTDNKKYINQLTVQVKYLGE